MDWRYKHHRHFLMEVRIKIIFERQYLLDVELMLSFEHALEALYLEVQEWVGKPFMLFRNYTITYLDKQLVARGMGRRELGSIV